MEKSRVELRSASRKETMVQMEGGAPIHRRLSKQKHCLTRATESADAGLELLLEQGVAALPVTGTVMTKMSVMTKTRLTKMTGMTSFRLYNEPQLCFGC